MSKKLVREERKDTVANGGTGSDTFQCFLPNLAKWCIICHEELIGPWSYLDK